MRPRMPRVLRERLSILVRFRGRLDDAAHIAIAVTNGVDFLVTWNFRHIANATMRVRIEQVCRQAGYEPATHLRRVP